VDTDKLLNTVIATLLVAGIIGSIQAYRELGNLASAVDNLYTEQSRLEQRIDRLETWRGYE